MGRVSNEELCRDNAFLQFSSIFFNLVRADFLTAAQSNINLMMFVVSFFLCRVVFGPWSWWQIVKVLFDEGLSEEALACAPTGHRYFVSLSGIVFHVLNGYWFYKILQKVQRKFAGASAKTPVTMKIKASNSGGELNEGGVTVSKSTTKDQD